MFLGGTPRRLPPGVYYRPWSDALPVKGRHRNVKGKHGIGGLNRPKSGQIWLVASGTATKPLLSHRSRRYSPVYLLRSLRMAVPKWWHHLPTHATVKTSGTPFQMFAKRLKSPPVRGMQNCTHYRRPQHLQWQKGLTMATGLPVVKHAQTSNLRSTGEIAGICNVAVDRTGGRPTECGQHKLWGDLLSIDVQGTSRHTHPADVAWMARSDFLHPENQRNF